MERKNIHKNITELFSGDYDYIVPLYQRNFAWGEPEITQLLQDLYESYQSERPYFVGSIIVLNRKSGTNRMLEVIDGQQRLTVITLLLKVLGKNYLPQLMATRLQYDSRDEVSEFLNTFSIPDISNGNNNFGSLNTFATAISTIKDCPLDADNENLSIAKLDRDNHNELESFANYLASQVYFVLAEMPQDTDVAAYFEIMNNSGDQLKKHEILKAQILASVKDRLSLNEMKSLAAIWDACAQMDVRVQRTIKANVRNRIFGDNYDSFIKENITMLCEEENDDEAPMTLDAIIQDDSYRHKETDKTEVEDNTDNIGESIIDFPNFLMQVFRLCYNDEYQEIEGKEIPLNEKDLLNVYQILADKIDGQEFIAQVLYYRIILDRYIIRTDTDSDNDKWTLKKPHKSSSNNGIWFGKTFGKTSQEWLEETVTNIEDNVIKALSMLQVSYPSRKYKWFLNEILSWFTFGEVEYSISWYLPRLNRLILGTLNEILQEYNDEWKYLGTSTPRFLLNAIDYLMYLNGANPNFEFKYYNSVEHHLPQSRGNIDNKYNSRTINSIGNLFLLSRRANSSLNDNDPMAKTDKAANQIESMPPNRRAIYEHTRKTRRWETADIEKHEAEICELINRRATLLQKVAIEESNLFYRACLSVTDYCNHKGFSGGVPRFSFRDMSTEKASFAKREVTRWMEQHLDSTLENFIEEQLASNLELTKDSWRKCFVKYPSVTEYCSQGNFTREEGDKGDIIYLLSGERSSRKDNELREHIFCEKARQANLDAYLNPYGVWIQIKDGKFLEQFPYASLYLNIYFDDIEFKGWCYGIQSQRGGNSKENRFLKNNGWSEDEDGLYILNENPILCPSTDDYDESTDFALNKIKKMIQQINSLCEE